MMMWLLAVVVFYCAVLCCTVSVVHFILPHLTPSHHTPQSHHNTSFRLTAADGQVVTETFSRDAVMKGKGEVPYRGGLLLQGKQQFGPSAFPHRQRKKKGKRGGKKGGGKRGLLRGPAGEGEGGDGEGGM